MLRCLMLTLLLLVYGCSIILAVDKGPKLDEISYICHPSDASGYSEWTSWKLEVETRSREGVTSSTTQFLHNEIRGRGNGSVPL